MQKLRITDNVVSIVSIYQGFYTCLSVYREGVSALGGRGSALGIRSGLPVEGVGVGVSAQVRIQDLVKGGPKLPRPKVDNIAEWSRGSEASYLQPV